MYLNSDVRTVSSVQNVEDVTLVKAVSGLKTLNFVLAAIRNATKRCFVVAASNSYPKMRMNKLQTFYFDVLIVQCGSTKLVIGCLRITRFYKSFRLTINQQYFMHV